MADIVLTVPNNQIVRVVNALCVAGGYTGDPADQPARNAFAKSVIAAQIRATVLRMERGQAAEQAMTAVVVSPISID